MNRNFGLKKQNLLHREHFILSCHEKFSSFSVFFMGVLTSHCLFLTLKGLSKNMTAVWCTQDLYTESRRVCGAGGALRQCVFIL